MHCFVGGWGGRIFLEKILIETGLDREYAIEKQQITNQPPTSSAFWDPLAYSGRKINTWKNHSKEKMRWANLWCETWQRTMIFNYIENGTGRQPSDEWSKCFSYRDSNNLHRSPFRMRKWSRRKIQGDWLTKKNGVMTCHAWTSMNIDSEFLLSLGNNPNHNWSTF